VSAGKKTPRFSAQTSLTYFLDSATQSETVRDPPPRASIDLCCVHAHARCPRYSDIESDTADLTITIIVNIIILIPENPQNRTGYQWKQLT